MVERLSPLSLSLNLSSPAQQSLLASFSSAGVSHSRITNFGLISSPVPLKSQCRSPQSFSSSVLSKLKSAVEIPKTLPVDSGSSCSKKMQTAESSIEEETFHVRKLEITDRKRGFIELLQQLTVCDSMSDEVFENQFLEIAKYGDGHLICVIEDTNSRKIVATGSMFIEKKFIRNCGKVGHIEDVVVDSSVRGKHLGKKIVEYLSDHARSRGCYKVILDCSAENRLFYERCGFKQKEVQMVKYFV